MVADQEPAVLSVCSSYSCLRLNRGPVGTRSLAGGLYILQIFRMKDSGNCVFGLRLLRGKAGIFPFSSVCEKRTPVRVENKDLLRNHSKRCPRFAFVLPILFSALFRSVISRMVPEISTPSSVSRGLR